MVYTPRASRSDSLFQNQNKKVCFYNIATHLGGAEKSLLDLVTWLENHRQEGFSPIVLLPKASGPLLNDLESRGISLKVIALPRVFLKISRANLLLTFFFFLASIPVMILYLARVRKFIKEEKISILHSNSIKCHVLSFFASFRLNVKVIWHIRDMIGDGLTKIILKLIARFSPVTVIANSQATADAFDHSESIVVYNGLDPNNFIRKRELQTIRRELDVSDKTFLVGILGVLARWKGQIEFLHMAARVSQELDDCHFIIIGDAIYDTVSDLSYVEKLNRLVSTMDLSQKVSFLGFREDIPQILSSLDVLVHASIKPEPFGRVIIEGMACELPVVASAAGGVLEIIEGGVTGLTYPAGDIQLLVQQVLQLAKDPQLRKRLGKSARQSFCQKFTLNAQMENLIGTYKRLI